MDRYIKIVAIMTVLVALGLASGCRSTETTTTTEFDAAGKVVKLTVIEKKDNGWILRKKGFTMHNNTFLGKISTGVDPSTGTPLPEIQMLLGDNYINDIPMMTDPPKGANYSEYLHVEKSLWGSELSVFDYDRKSSGDNAPESSIKITIKDAQLPGGK